MPKLQALDYLYFHDTAVAPAALLDARVITMTQVRCGRLDTASDTSIFPKACYLLLASASFIIGYASAHSIPVQLGGDTGQYIDIANALLGRGGDFYYYRSWGYPIFLILTGFPWHHDPFIVIAVQVMLGSFIPFLIGDSLEKLGVARWIAVSCAVFSFASFAPIVLAHAILSDEVSQFLLYFLIWQIALTLSRPVNSPLRYAAAITTTLFTLSLLRPANVFLGLGVLPVYFILAERDAKRVPLYATGMLLAATILWFPVQTTWISWSQARRDQPITHLNGSLAGAMFFWNIYSSGAAFVGHSTILPETGPCSKKIYDAVAKHPDVIAGQRIGVANVESKHTLLNHYVIWQSMEKEYGAERMDRIFWCSAFEGIRAEPRSLLYFVDGLFSFFLVSDVIYNDGTRQAWPSFSVYASVIPRDIGEASLYLGTAIKIVAFIAALAMGLRLARTKDRRRTLGAVVWITLLYLAAVHVTFAAPHWRYSLVTIPGLLLLAFLGLDSLLRNDSCKLTPFRKPVSNARGLNRPL